MLKTLTSITTAATKRVALLILFCLVALSIGNALGQQRTGLGSGSGSGSGAGSSNRSTQQTGNDATTVFRSARDFITDGEWAKVIDRL